MSLEEAGPSQAVGGGTSLDARFLCMTSVLICLMVTWLTVVQCWRLFRVFWRLLLKGKLLATLIPMIES